MSSFVHDDVFAQIAHRSGSVQNLLDEFFGFLHRRTDFYVQFEPTPKNAPGSVDSNKRFTMGFPMGMAETMVLRSLHKYPFKDYEKVSNAVTEMPKAPDGSEARHVEKRIERKPQSDLPSLHQSNQSEPTKIPIAAKSVSQAIALTAEGKQIPIGNGGIADNYYWTQNLKDITVYVEAVPGVKSKDVSCVIRTSSLRLEVKGKLLIDGPLEESINAEDSMWTIARCNDDAFAQIVITLDKRRETWWKHVIVGHPEIDTNKVDHLIFYM